MYLECSIYDIVGIDFLVESLQSVLYCLPTQPFLLLDDELSAIASAYHPVDTLAHQLPTYTFSLERLPMAILTLLPYLLSTCDPLGLVLDMVDIQKVTEFTIIV